MPKRAPPDTPFVSYPRRKRAKYIDRKKYAPITLSRVMTKANGIHDFVFSTEGYFTLNNTLGFNSVSQSLQFAFTNSQTLYSLGGSALSIFGTGVYDNATQCDAVFDSYRIKEVWVDIYYNCNNSSMNSPLISLPILFCVIDHNDSNALANANAALGYGGVRTIQLGNSSGSNNGAQRVVLKKPTTEAVVATTTAGTYSTGLGNVSPWIDTDNTNIPHYGMKFWYEPITSNATLVGDCFFVIRSHMQFKNTK